MLTVSSWIFIVSCDISPIPFCHYRLQLGKTLWSLLYHPKPEKVRAICVVKPNSMLYSTVLKKKKCD